MPSGVNVSAVAPLDLSDFLISGEAYTFSFTIKSISASSSDVLIDLQQVRGLSHADLPFYSRLAERMDVAFIWAGDGATVVANVGQSIIDAVEGNHWLTTVDFVKAVGGTEAPAAIFPLGTTGDALTPSAGSLKSIAIFALVALGLLVAFQGVSTVKEVV